MIDTLQVIILALVQGLTEFLPVSSSAHLILVPQLLGWPDQGIVFDVAVHLGTLIAVVAYFRRDIMAMVPDFFGSLTGKGMTDQARLAWGVGIGTIPAGLAGLLAKDYIEANLRSPLVIATTTIVFGLLLLFADRTAKLVRNIDQMGWGHYIAIGCAQALALIPGTSRSGITMTFALMMGYSREAAARFSFLLSIPIIALSSLLVLKELTEYTGVVDWQALILGVVLSAIAAFTCILLFMKWIQRTDMSVFVVYRLLLGAFLFYVFW